MAPDASSLRLAIISGLSGSGKSVALHMLEDLGYYCVDNLPAPLLAGLVEHSFNSSDEVSLRTAIGVDARNVPADIARVPVLVADLRKRGVECDLIFLTASDETLLKRYSETRRKHPLSRNDLGLRAAIDKDRALLAPIIDAADLIIDTSRTNVHELREMIRQRVHGRSSGTMSILFESFAFKSGVPADADFVFDVRVLPNPFWDPSLRGETGLDDSVADFLDKQPMVEQMYSDLIALLDRWIPEFERSNRSYLTVAIGCTGGHHRSVFIAEKLAQHFGQRYTRVLTQHTELPGWHGRRDGAPGLPEA